MMSVIVVVFTVIVVKFMKNVVHTFGKNFAFFSISFGWYDKQGNTFIILYIHK